MKKLSTRRKSYQTLYSSALLNGNSQSFHSFRDFLPSIYYRRFCFNPFFFSSVFCLQTDIPRCFPFPFFLFCSQLVVESNLMCSHYLACFISLDLLSLSLPSPSFSLSPCLPLPLYSTASIHSYPIQARTEQKRPYRALWHCSIWFLIIKKLIRKKYANLRKQGA